MSQRIIRLLATAAVAVLFATGPVQAQTGPRETGVVWRWIGSFQEQAVRVLHLWTGGVAQRKAGPMIDPDGITGSQPNSPTVPSCQGSCTDQGHMIDPDG